MVGLLGSTATALGILSPAFEKLFEYSGRRGFHFVILDPNVERWEVNGDVEKAILRDGFIGEDDGEHDYRRIALSKVEQAWKTRMPNIFVQSSAPVFLSYDDTPYYGSFIYNGLIVAASGLQPWFDELVLMWIACTVQQVHQHYRQKWIAQYPEEDFFL